MPQTQDAEATACDPVVASAAAKSGKPGPALGGEANPAQTSKPPGAGVVKLTAADKPEFTVTRKELLQELVIVQRIVDRKATIPILNNILFEAKCDTLTLTATDLDLSIRATCPARIRKPGSCTIPARKFYDYLRLLSEDDIHIKVLDNGHIQIKSGRSHTRMVGLSRHNFPTLPIYPQDNSVKLGTQMLRDLIAKSIFSVSVEETRYTLGGALLLLNPENAVMVATDGYRLAYVEYAKALEVKGPQRILVPKKALGELASLLGTEKEHLGFASDDSHLFFLIDGRLLTCRQLTGQFPNFQAIMPNHSKSISVPTVDALLTIQRVSQFADERSRAVRLQIGSGEIRFSSSSPEDGESEEAIETKYEGDPLRMAFNSEYLEQFLKVVKSERFQLQFEKPETAIELRPEGVSSTDHKYRYVVMPMRV